MSTEGDGPPILLLHGFPDSLHMWHHVTPSLVQAGFKVIAYDQRGYGDTDAPLQKEAYIVENIVADAVAVLKVLGIESSVNLVGHDWGAVIGWQICLRHPELISRYVAVSVGHPLAYRNAGWQQKLKAWYVVMFQFPGLAESMLSANDWQSIRRMAGDEEDKKTRLEYISRPGRLTAALNWYRANFSRLFNSTYGKNKVPTLGIYSTGDVALTREQMTNSQNYMDAEWKYVQIEGSSHWIPLDKPAELARQIIEWTNHQP